MIDKAYLSKKMIFKEALQISGISYGINCKNFQPLKSLQDVQEMMKKPQLDLAQLKARVGAKLKRKRGPLSPVSTSSAKKRVAEKENPEDEPSSFPARKETASTSISKKDTPLPLTSPAPEVERVAVVAIDPPIIPAQLPIVPAQPSIPSSTSKEKFFEVDTFCRSIKAALLEPPVESGSDIASRNTNCYHDLAEISKNKVFNIYNFIFLHCF